jgi:hypothetical protein
MFGKKKNIEPIKNQTRSADTQNEKKSSARKPKFSFFRKKEKKEKTQRNSRFKIMRTIVSVLDGSILKSDFAMRNAPLAIFVFFWILVAIANNYTAQRKAKQIDQAKREIKDLRDEYISIKSQLMYSTKMSEVAHKLEQRGIKEPVRPPFKLLISGKGGKHE